MVHPYPNKEGKLVKHGLEAMRLTGELIDTAEKFSDEPVALRTGILRADWKDISLNDDFEKREDGIFIKTGMTVDVKSYLNGLLKSLPSVEFRKTAFDGKEVDNFDRVVWAIGAGIQEKRYDLPIQFVKGQAFIMRHPTLKLDHSVVDGGYISPMSDNRFLVASTYEHHFVDDKPDYESAAAILRRRHKRFDEFELLEIFSAVRVCRKGSYTPIIEQVGEKEWIFTGLGSKGLLYHGYYAKELVDMLM